MRNRIVALAFALWLLAAQFSPLLAAYSTTPVFVQTPKLATVAFIQGTDAAGTYKTVYAGAANGPGSKILGIWVTSNDGSASHLVTIQISTSASAHCSPQSNCVGGVAVTIPISSGFANGVPAINMLSPTYWPGLPVDSDGNPYLFLSATTQTIEATYATALTASTQIAITVVAAEF